MKLVVVLAVLCCFALGALGTPVRTVSGTSLTENVSGRQAPAAPVAAAADDDDDDDDDDDGLDLGLDDDDDDDDDDDEEDGDEDDEDDGDYVERFIEDIFGGEDDDDDDDDDNAVPAAAPVADTIPIQSLPSPVVQSAQPVIPPNVQADLNSAVAEASEDGAQDVEYTEEAAEEQAASAVVEATEEGAQSVPLAAEVQPAASPLAAAEVATNADSDDDDDDDDDDDEALDIPIPGVDDDDDDDDDTEDATDDDDDDDDDDDALTDLTEARRARAMSSSTSTHVPAIYVAKYNRFVDNILGRINKILRTNYNPVTVQLTNADASTKSNKKKKSKGKGKGNGKNKNGTKSATKRGEEMKSTEKSAPSMIASDSDIRNASLLNNNVDLATEVKIEETKNTPVVAESTTLASNATQNTQENSRATATTTKKTKKTNKRKSSTKKNKTKATSTKSRPKAKATLYGLSSLQRVGDVTVRMMSDHTTVRTKFSLGPLTLRVEKEFGRSGKKELRSATATTAEMSGKLNLRVLHGGAATLHSIRVLQPKQVRVESADDHDRTREFVWKRSSHIAHVVSQKLSSATKSMLRPPPAVQAA